MAASPEQSKPCSATELPSTAATNRFQGRVSIITGGASGKLTEPNVLQAAVNAHKPP